MDLPEVVSRGEWLAPRQHLLAREKELTRQRDALNADRRRLPMVRVGKQYAFEGPEGAVGLPDLFGDSSQLIVQHVMFDPAWEAACPSCTASMDESTPALLDHLKARNTSYVRTRTRGDCGAASCAETACSGGVTLCKAARMSFPTSTSAEDVIDQPARAQFEAFLDEHRAGLSHCLDGLTEEQARRSLVRSRATLLGLVKHATFVEKVWFDEAVTCRPRAEIGIPATPDESFILADSDTIATVQQAHREACQTSRRAASALGLDDIVRGNRRGPLPLRWVYFHMLRELAQHCGHADILREQIVSG